MGMVTAQQLPLICQLLGAADIFVFDRAPFFKFLGLGVHAEPEKLRNFLILIGVLTFLFLSQLGLDFAFHDPNVFIFFNL